MARRLAPRVLLIDSSGLLGRNCFTTTKPKGDHFPLDRYCRYVTSAILKARPDYIYGCFNAPIPTIFRRHLMPDYMNRFLEDDYRTKYKMNVGIARSVFHKELLGIRSLQFNESFESGDICASIVKEYGQTYFGDIKHTMENGTPEEAYALKNQFREASPNIFVLSFSRTYQQMLAYHYPPVLGIIHSDPSFHSLRQQTFSNNECFYPTVNYDDESAVTDHGDSCIDHAEESHSTSIRRRPTIINSCEVNHHRHIIDYLSLVGRLNASVPGIKGIGPARANKLIQSEAYPEGGLLDLLTNEQLMDKLNDAHPCVKLIRENTEDTKLLVSEIIPFVQNAPISIDLDGFHAEHDCTDANAAADGANVTHLDEDSMAMRIMGPNERIGSESFYDLGNFTGLFEKLKGFATEYDLGAFGEYLDRTSPYLKFNLGKNKKEPLEPIQK